MRLSDLISHHKNQIVERWAQAVAGRLAPRSLPAPLLIDHLPDFLDEVTKALRALDGAGSPGNLPEKSPIAEVHGRQRLAVGIDLAALVREYGLVHDVILRLAEEKGLRPELRELRLLGECTATGAVDAVEQYVLLRDRQLREQAARHLGFLAHELRNPLQSAVLGFSALKSSGAAVVGRIADAVERSHERLKHLVDNTIIEARLGDSAPLVADETDLSAMLEEARLEAIADAEVRGVGVQLQVQAGLHMRADAKLLRSAVSNLLRNAVKFSRRGGTVQVRGHAAQGRVLIEFEDECGGLPAGKVKDLFDPYVQAGKDRTGFGLGLAIAKQATEAHGGSLRVTDLPGKGCVFMLDLPQR